MIGTPSNLELLLHCHTTPGPHPRWASPAIIEGVTNLLDDGMIKRTNDTNVYTTTEKGQFYIAHLMRVPFPVHTWRIPEAE